MENGADVEADTLCSREAWRTCAGGDERRSGRAAELEERRQREAAEQCEREEKVQQRSPMVMAAGCAPMAVPGMSSPEELEDDDANFGDYIGRDIVNVPAFDLSASSAPGRGKLVRRASVLLREEAEIRNAVIDWPSWATRSTRVLSRT